MNRITIPIGRYDAIRVEPHLFLQCPTCSLKEAALQLAAQAIRIDDLPCISGDYGSFYPDLTTGSIYMQIYNYCYISRLVLIA